MDYDVLDADTAEGLREKVKERLAEGWQLHGGVSVAICFGEWEVERKGYTEREVFRRYAQAITKATA